jgi:hypothetical protein
MENTKQNDQIAVGILWTYLDFVSMGSSIKNKDSKKGCIY